MNNEQTLLTLLALGTLVPAVLWLGYAIPNILTLAFRRNDGQDN